MAPNPPRQPPQAVRAQRELALAVLAAALQAVEPGAAIRRHLALHDHCLQVGERAYDLRRFERVLVVGAGKAGGAMAAAVEALLGDRVADGVVVVKRGYTAPTRRVALVEAGHPVPDAAGLEGTRRLVELLRGATERDLVLCLLSGGGSALLPLPQDDLALDDLQQLTQALLRSGASIDEINTVRKHLDAAKGGGLARLAQPAQVVSLVLSDVVGNPLDTIASGPTVPDPTTYADAAAVLERYGLWPADPVQVPPPAQARPAGRQLPPTQARPSGRQPPPAIPERVARRLRLGVEGRLPETPKPGDPLFERVQNLVVASNEQAALAAVAEAERRGLRALLLSTYVEGEAREVGKVFAALARELATANRPLPRPACLVAGGETTVTVRGRGRGGRCQELALAAALELGGDDELVVLAAGTDGTDGPTDAAGAVVDAETVDRGAGAGASARAALDDNDAYAFLESSGDLIRSGPTNTNLMDLYLVIRGACL
ncbi:MAG: DUF4147 domain-containing protein [Chloroflexi bacterium]|nr:DUF4147 domain-containing protein [Chloroflexota bacterium]